MLHLSKLNGFQRGAALVALVAAFGGCASVVPLGNVARRTADPKSLAKDVTVDTTSRELAAVKRIAWAAYSVTFDCEDDATCGYTPAERETLTREIADTSFVAFDRELRAALGRGREFASATTTAKSAAFKQDVQTGSFRSTVGRWLSQLGLKRAKAPVVATASGLKAIDPSELGWSGGAALSKLSRDLGVDGVLVGHIRVTADEDREARPRKLVINGPTIWLFSATSGSAVAVAGLKPRWHLEQNAGYLDHDPELASDSTPRNTVPALASAAKEVASPAKLNTASELSRDGALDWRGLDAVATGFSSRVADALKP